VFTPCVDFEMLSVVIQFLGEQCNTPPPAAYPAYGGEEGGDARC